MAEKNHEETDPQGSESDTPAEQLLRDVADIKLSLEEHDKTTNDRIGGQTKQIRNLLTVTATLLVAAGVGGFTALSSSFNSQAQITSAAIRQVRTLTSTQISDLRKDARKDNRELRSEISRLAAEIHGLAIAVGRLNERIKPQTR